MSRYRLDEKIARPAIYHLNFDFKDQAVERNITSWGWVKIPDLVSCLNMIFSGKNISEIRDAEIFGRYGLLCKMVGDKPLYTWVNPDDFEIDGERIPTSYADTFIPAGWNDRIIRVADDDIIRVTADPWIRLEVDRGCMRQGLLFGLKQRKPFLGPIFEKWQKIGCKKDGEKTVVCFNRESGSSTEEARSITMYGSTSTRGVLMHG